MRWFRLLAIFATLAFVFVGCDDKDSNEAKKYELQKALDDGDYGKVLRMTSNCGNDEACNMDRAAAYMGRAGFTLPSVMVAVSDNNNDEFYKALGRKASSNSANDLDQSKSIYTTKIIPTTGTPCKKGTPDHAKASYYAKAACFNNGMVTMAKAATLMSSLDELANKYSDFGAGKTYDGVSVDTLAGDAATLLNSDLDTLIELFDTGDDADIKKEIDDVKADICSTVGGGCNINSITAANITAYINAKK